MHRGGSGTAMGSAGRGFSACHGAFNVNPDRLQMDSTFFPWASRDFLNSGLYFFFTYISFCVHLNWEWNWQL